MRGRGRSRRYHALSQSRKKLPYPFEPASAFFGICSLPELLICEMRSDTIERLAMHRLCAQLNFECASVASVNRRVNALVAVWFRKGDVIFDFSGHRTPMSVNNPESRVALG